MHCSLLLLKIGAAGKETEKVRLQNISKGIFQAREPYLDLAIGKDGHFFLSTAFATRFFLYGTVLRNK